MSDVFKVFFSAAATVGYRGYSPGDSPMLASTSFAHVEPQLKALGDGGQFWKKEACWEKVKSQGCRLSKFVDLAYHCQPLFIVK